MTYARWHENGMVATCPTTGRQFQTNRITRDGQRVFLACRCCDNQNIPAGTAGHNPTQAGRHEYLLDDVHYHEQGVTA